MTYRKKLIEVALPLEAINKEAAREKSIRHGHPSTLHLWWARRPLAACRAVLFAQLVDDPSSHPEIFPTVEAQDQERQRLFRLIEELVKWDNVTNETVLNAARAEIRRSCERGDGYADVSSASAGQRPAHPTGWSSRGYHPHFSAGGTVQHVTFRLSDSLPESLVTHWRDELQIAESVAAEDPRRLELIERVAAYEDKGHGECHLRDPRIACIVQDALLHFDGERYRLLEWCIMPNHVHALIAEMEGHPLGSVVQSWKSFTAKEANKLLGRTGTFWMADYFDRFIRNEKHFTNARAYIRNNPVKAGLCASPEAWPWGSAGCGDVPSASAGRRPAHPLPAVYDPFAGGGSIPLEAQRLGLEAHASDLNPVAVLINKALIEIPPKWAGNPPVNPKSRKDFTSSRGWRGAEGLAEDVRYYGQWMRDEAEKRIGHLYPKVTVTAEMAKARPDLKKYEGKELTVIAWLWARTVPTPNPAFAGVEVPLVSNFMLSTKEGKETYVEPVVDGRDYRFEVRVGKPDNPEAARMGTKLGRGSNFRCVVSGSNVTGDYIKAEGQAGRMGASLMAIVAEGDRSRVYLAPTPEMEQIAKSARAEWGPEGDVPARLTGGTCVPYGLKQWQDLFTPRQLVALNTFCDLVQEARIKVEEDARAAGLGEDVEGLEAGGIGAKAYADAVAVYLAFGVSRSADYWSSLTSWHSGIKMEALRNTFGRQALPMVWDYAEGNPFSDSSGNWSNNFGWVEKSLSAISPSATGFAIQADASSQRIALRKVISTDPPYYDNIGYADLSDFFYVWLRRSLRPVLSNLFSTMAVPKAEELIASAYRHGGKDKAERFFLEGMTSAMRRLAEQSLDDFPVTIYYAFKQSEDDDVTGQSSTGWETFLEAVLSAGFSIHGTWPMRTELANRMIGSGTNALASSIVLVCRKKDRAAAMTSRKDFLRELRAELPKALRLLQQGNIAPVDLAQASIGPGMAVFSRHSRVVEANGEAMTVKTALGLINQMLDEVLAEQEGEFDPETRWALAWFEQFAFDPGAYGDAETLSKAKNTSVAGLVEAGFLEAKSGKVRLLPRPELSAKWDPREDKRLTIWEVSQHLIRVLETKGEAEAGALLRLVGGVGEVARDLAYRLYTLCERKKWAEEARAYNGLVIVWPELQRLAAQAPAPAAGEGDLFGGGV